MSADKTSSVGIHSPSTFSRTASARLIRVHGMRNEKNVTKHPLTTNPSSVYSQTYFDFNYPDLSRWVKSIPNGPRNCFVTFGPGLSYFASAPGNGSIWAGIPGDLSDKIQKAYDTPNCVSLGMNNAWFVMWPDGYYSWKFYGSYGSLDNILKAAEPRTVSVGV